MRVFIVDWSSSGNYPGEPQTVYIRAESLPEAQDKFWAWLRKTEVFTHMWNLSFSFKELRHDQPLVIE